jgi:hypothetical protein
MHHDIVVYIRDQNCHFKSPPPLYNDYILIKISLKKKREVFRKTVDLLARQGTMSLACSRDIWWKQVGGICIETFQDKRETLNEFWKLSISVPQKDNFPFLLSHSPPTDKENFIQETLCIGRGVNGFSPIPSSLSFQQPA